LGEDEEMTWRPFEEARKFARSLKLSSSVKWYEFCKSPDFPSDIPKRPERTFENEGWRGYSDWLGTTHGKYLRKGKGRLSFEEAREYVHSLKLKGLKDWWIYCKSGKRPANIPASPHESYKDEWKGYGDWTGTGRVRHTKFLPFEEAREYARSLNLDSVTSWNNFTESKKRPSNIPANPETTYKKDWQGWGDFLGTGKMIRKRQKKELQYLPYEKARQYVRTLNIKGQKEWIKYVKTDKRPANIPSAPYNYYDEWKGYADWLGTKRIRPTSFLPFAEAREFARSLGLKNLIEWDIFAQSDKKPIDIPTHPEKTYDKEWKNWADWLGSGKISTFTMSKIYLPFIEAEKEYKKLAKQYGLKNGQDWATFARTHKKLLSDLRIPASPWQVYSKDRVTEAMNRSIKI
jgi:hypothetical protein